MGPEYIIALVAAVSGLIGAVGLVLKAVASRIDDKPAPPVANRLSEPHIQEDDPLAQTGRFYFGMSPMDRMSALEQRMTAAENRLDALDRGMAKLEADLRADLGERRREEELTTGRVIEAVSGMRAEFGEVRKEFHSLAMEFAYFRGKAQRDQP